MIGFGFTKTYHQIMALRFVLGIFEAGFFPGTADLHWLCFFLLANPFT